MIKPPAKVTEWFTLVATILALSGGVMTGVIKLYGLDTVAARDEAIAPLQEQVDEINMRTWCILWEVPAPTCQATFNGRWR